MGGKGRKGKGREGGREGEERGGKEAGRFCPQFSLPSGALAYSNKP